MGLCANVANTRLYVSDRHLISQVTLGATEAAWINSVAGTEKYTVNEISGSQTSGMRDSTNGTAARYHEPRFVTIDSYDTFLYISDVGNYKIRRLTVNPNGVTGSSYLQVVTLASFSGGKEVNGIALKTDYSALFAAATDLHGIWKIPIQGVYPALTYPIPSANFEWLGHPAKTSGQLVDGAIASAKFYGPTALSIDDRERQFVSTR